MSDLVGSFYKKPAPRVPTAEATDAMGVGAVERRMLRELLPTTTAAATAGDAGAPGGGKKDDPLVVTLLAKVQTLEDQNARLRSMIIEKEKEVFALKRAAAEATATTAAAADAAEEGSLLADENARLRRQIRDMEAFLRDYGLVWIGPQASSRSSRPPSPLEAVAAATAAAAAAAPTTINPAAAAPLPAAAGGWPDVDFPVLLLRLQQLNELVGAGKARVVKGRDGAHRLEVPAGFPLTIYRNGFMLGRGPFRSYAEDTARAFIQVRPSPATATTTGDCTMHAPAASTTPHPPPPLACFLCCRTSWTATSPRS